MSSSPWTKNRDLGDKLQTFGAQNVWLESAITPLTFSLNGAAEITTAPLKE